MWFARPGMEKDPSAWRPAADGSETPGTELPGEKASGQLIPPAKAAQTAAEAPAPRGNAAVFFVTPTTYYSRSSWNPPPADRNWSHRPNHFVQGLAAPFSHPPPTCAP